MNAPLPHLHVEYERARALRDLLAHDGRADEGDGLDRARDVAKRIELLVGRSELEASDRSWRSRPSSARLSSRRIARSTRKPGIASSLSSVPPVWPRPRPDIIGTTTPHAADKRCEDERRLVADAPGAVLVDLGHRRRRTGRPRLPDRSIASVSAAVSSSTSREARSPSEAPTSGSRGWCLASRLRRKKRSLRNEGRQRHAS